MKELQNTVQGLQETLSAVDVRLLDDTIDTVTMRFPDMEQEMKEVRADCDAIKTALEHQTTETNIVKRWRNMQAAPDRQISEFQAGQDPQRPGTSAQDVICGSYHGSVCICTPLPSEHIVEDGIISNVIY